MTYFKLIIILTVGIYSSLSQAMNSLDLFKIETEIGEFLEARYMEIYDGRIEFSIGALRTNLKLNPCDNVEYFLPSYTNNSARVTVGLQCNSPMSWTIYLPVTVKVFKPVVKVTNNLARNTVITEDDITIQETDIMRHGTDYFDLPIDVIGMAVKRPIQAGKILTKNLITKPVIIKRGDIVDIVIQAKGLMVKTKAMATENGVQDEIIKVKNLKSKRVIEAIAIKPGIVKIEI